MKSALRAGTHLGKVTRDGTVEPFAARGLVALQHIPIGGEHIGDRAHHDDGLDVEGFKDAAIAGQRLHVNVGNERAFAHAAQIIVDQQRQIGLGVAARLRVNDANQLAIHRVDGGGAQERAGRLGRKGEYHRWAKPPRLFR